MSSLPLSPSPAPAEAMKATAPGEAKAAIARQAIVDEGRAVFGYELFEKPRAAANEDAVLFDAIADAGAEALAGRKIVFMQCSFENMADGYLELLDPARVVLEIPTLASHSDGDIAIRHSLLKRARASGFRLSFDKSVLLPAYATWLPLASFIKLDLRTMSAQDTEQAIKRARGSTRAQLVAEGIDSAEQYEQMKKLGIKLFQGHWFAKPAEIKDPTAQVSQAAIVQLINLVRQEAEVGAIEDVLKRDPTLSYRLLRLINSCGFGLSMEITSFRHAVMIMGLNKLFRWATLLMTTSRARGVAPAAGTTAVVRGRLMELLAAELMPKEECDNAFVIGVFSLLDTMLGMPLDQALANISLPEEVVQALLFNEGTFAPFLALAKACESGDEASFARAAEALQLSNHQINWAHLQALMWADQLEAGN